MLYVSTQRPYSTFISIRKMRELGHSEVKRLLKVTYPARWKMQEMTLQNLRAQPSCRAPGTICHEVPVSLTDVSGGGCFQLNRFWGSVYEQAMLLDGNGLSIIGGILSNLSVCSIESSDRGTGNVSGMQNPRPSPDLLTQTLHLPKFPDDSVHSNVYV